MKGRHGVGPVMHIKLRTRSRTNVGLRCGKGLDSSLTDVPTVTPVDQNSLKCLGASSMISPAKGPAALTAELTEVLAARVLVLTALMPEMKLFFKRTFSRAGMVSISR